MSFKIKYQNTHVLYFARVFALGVFIMGSVLASWANYDAAAVSVDELDLKPPRPPMNFTAESSDQKIHLEWASVDRTDVTLYKVYMRVGEEHLETREVTETSIDVEDLENEKMYYFTVTALDAEQNESKPSNEIGITPSKVKTITQKDFTVSAWMPTNWDIEDAFEAYENHIDIYDVISPFWFNLIPDGTLEPKGGARDKAFIRNAHQNGVKVLPSITNNYSTSKSSSVLSSPGTILNHVDIIVSEVVKNNYDGIDIDYENVAASEKDMYTFFMRNLSDRLHKEDKLLSITSQPKLSDHYIWNGPGAIDWDVAGEVADYLRVMNYDFSRPNTSPGPVAPKEWLRKSMQYGLEHVPREKLLGGIPFYGYDWGLTPEGETSGLVWDGVVNTREIYDIKKVFWDEEAGESWYEYTDEVGPRKAYFNDARSIEAKLKVITEENAGGITIWRLGSEDPEIFPLIRKYLGKQKALFSPANVKAIPKSRTIKVSWQPNTNDDAAVGHYVYMGDSPDKLKKIAEVVDQDYHVISGLENDKKYYMRVRAFNNRGEESKPTNLIHVAPTTLVTAAPVTNLGTASVGTSHVELAWSHDEHPDFVGNILGYDVRYSKEEITEDNWHDAEKLPSEHVQTQDDGSNLFRVMGLTPDTPYWFGVKTIDEFQQSSSISNIISVKTLDISPPSKPESVSFEKINREVVMTWERGIDYDLAGYKIYYTGQDGVSRWLFIGLRDTFTLDFLNREDVYSIKLVAIDNAGNESPASETSRLLPSEL